ALSPAHLSSTGGGAGGGGASPATPTMPVSGWGVSPSGGSSAPHVKQCSRSCCTSSCAIAPCHRRWPAMALLATHGGLSLEWCAVIYHISPMALFVLICAFGHQSLVRM